MKLLNKKTGEIGNLISGVNLEEYQVARDDYKLLAEYDSLTELIKDWEDYKPAEPLIKDEKIRKAVRAWAEANEEEHIKVKGGCSFTKFECLYTKLTLELSCEWTRDGVYTITELCGKEEE